MVILWHLIFIREWHLIFIRDIIKLNMFIFASISISTVSFLEVSANRSVISRLSGFSVFLRLSLHWPTKVNFLTRTQSIPNRKWLRWCEVRIEIWRSSISPSIGESICQVFSAFSNFGIKNYFSSSSFLFQFEIGVAMKVCYVKKLFRPWQDSNLQSPDPKSGALSIRPHGRLYQQVDYLF